MKYETLFDNARIQKVGFGTWRIGGGSFPERSQDEQALSALRSALKLGYTHFDTAEMYGGGHAEDLLGRAIRDSKIKRESLFLTSKVMPTHLHFDDVLRACEGSLQRLGADYLDLYLIHWPNDSIPLEETFRALNQLVAHGKVKYLGVSNFDLALLKKSQALAKTPIVTNQVPYSLSDRSYVRNGVLEYCQANNILLTAYSPIGEGRMKIDPALQAVAAAHQASAYQIALAWLVAQPKVITIPMSFNREHQAENFNAADIELSETEMQQLTDLG
jgi:diketogulonate reductase-like aldo/keto reductase